MKELMMRERFFLKGRRGLKKRIYSRSNASVRVMRFAIFEIR